MLPESLKRTGAFASVLLAAVLVGCADQATQPPTGSFNAGQGVAGCTSGGPHEAPGVGTTPDSILAFRCAAQSGDLIDVQLDELHATQPSLGYDEVYYKLGRYTSDKDELAGNFNKRFDDWCEANGQAKAATVQPGARLDNPGGFTCTVAIGSETQADIDVMKTVVIGPRGELYLTDGHHTFTSFWETPDGGPKMHVRVRVEGNLSGLSMAEFWRQMQAHQWVWLYDAHDQPINVQQLPRNLGLKEFGNDPYRGVLYFARDIGYVQLPENAIFQEFYWGRWLRGQADPALQLGNYNLNDFTSYLALVRAASMAMTAMGDGDIVSDGRTALEMGKMALWNNGFAENKGEFGKLSKPYSDAKPGKLAFALQYKASLP